MPIGGVLALKDAVIPNAVGKDIGCGMCAVKTSLKAENLSLDTLKAIRGRIVGLIPVGFRKHSKPQDADLLSLEKFDNLKIVKSELHNALISLGTLGSGNHFIEIQKDKEHNIWIMIHSGSRNLGLKVADHYNKLAKDINEKLENAAPPAWDLAHLPMDTQEAQDYLLEMQFCIDFAFANRKLMMNRIFEAFHAELKHFKTEPMINIAHNYASLETHFGEDVFIHRKGATQAKKDQIGIIPGSQGTRSYIVRGKGNALSFESCSHGAGRKMSRKKARESLDLNKEIKLLNEKNIVHAIRSKKDLDEAPSAYKNISKVMKNQKDLVSILEELSPLVVIKA